MAAIFAQLNAGTLVALRNLAVLAAIFTLLPMVVGACNKALPWWRKPDLSTDLCWIFVPKLFNQFVQTCLLVFGLLVCYRISDPTEVVNFLTQGAGPLGGLGFWLQLILYLLGSDLLMYLTHRVMHGQRLWRFHAVHHSPTYLDWISAARLHPVDAMLHSSLSDVVMLLLGIPPEVLVWTMPFTVGSSAIAHANLDWNFGPFRYLLVSPVFHRWHHTSASRGGSSNFAGTFSFIDLMFGTFYMPVGQRPDAFGLDDAAYPKDFAGQLLQPFRSRASAGDGLPRSITVDSNPACQPADSFLQPRT